MLAAVSGFSSLTGSGAALTGTNSISGVAFKSGSVTANNVASRKFVFQADS